MTDQLFSLGRECHESWYFVMLKCRESWRFLSSLETWVATAPESRQFCLVFVGLFAGAGSKAAAVTLDTAADESKNKMADGVARSPSRLCSRDGKICCYGDALGTIFLLAFVPCFLLFVFFSFYLLFFLHPGMFIFFVSLRLCSSHLLLSASTYVFFLLVVSFAPYPISEFFCFCSFTIFLL